MADIIIDSYRCSGCETCTEMCPDIFRIDEATEKASLVNPSPQITEAIRQAAAFCPEKCIEILQ